MAEPEGAELEAIRAHREELRETYLRPLAERPASTAGGVHHLALVCKDVEETIRFYQDFLGFPLVELVENRDYAGSSHFFFDIGNRNLLGFFDFPGLGNPPYEETIGAVQHLALSVDREQFDTAKARLDEAGVDYLGPDRGADDSLYLRDPNGVGLELYREDLGVFEGTPLLND
jgi:glyoxylase I family protein